MRADLLVVAAIGVMVVLAALRARTAARQAPSAAGLARLRPGPARDRRPSGRLSSMPVAAITSAPGPRALSAYRRTSLPLHRRPGEGDPRLRLRDMPPTGSRRPDEPTYGPWPWPENHLDRAALGTDRPSRASAESSRIRQRGTRPVGARGGRHVAPPPDDSAFGFDNGRRRPGQFWRYCGLRPRPGGLVPGGGRRGGAAARICRRQDLSQDQHLQEMPLGTFGGVLARRFPWTPMRRQVRLCAPT
jgi:hypothetical protein